MLVWAQNSGRPWPWPPALGQQMWGAALQQLAVGSRRHHHCDPHAPLAALPLLPGLGATKWWAINSVS